MGRITRNTGGGMKNRGTFTFRKIIRGVLHFFGRWFKKSRKITEYESPFETGSGRGIGPGKATKKGYHKGCFGGLRYIKWRAAERKAEEALARAQRGVIE